MTRPFPIDHVSVGVSDMGQARAFYRPVLGTLGLKPVYEGGEAALAFGNDEPVFWINLPLDTEPATAGNGSHICFNARTRKAVDAFHEAGLVNGGSDAGAPGLRPEYTPTYYAAFLFDPDGNKIEAVCHGEG